MGQGYWRRLVRLFKRTVRVERRLNIEELLLLAEAIFDYGLKIRASEKWSALPPPYIIIEVPELVQRLRKTPQAIQDAFLLLRAAGFAELLDCHGHWKLNLAGGSQRSRWQEVA